MIVHKLDRTSLIMGDLYVNGCLWLEVDGVVGWGYSDVRFEVCAERWGLCWQCSNGGFRKNTLCLPLIGIREVRDVENTVWCREEDVTYRFLVEMVSRANLIVTCQNAFPIVRVQICMLALVSEFAVFAGWQHDQNCSSSAARFEGMQMGSIMLPRVMIATKDKATNMKFGGNVWTIQAKVRAFCEFSPTWGISPTNTSFLYFQETHSTSDKIGTRKHSSWIGVLAAIIWNQHLKLGWKMRWEKWTLGCHRGHKKSLRKQGLESLTCRWIVVSSK